jgi:hypothetical protein
MKVFDIFLSLRLTIYSEKWLINNFDYFWLKWIFCLTYGSIYKIYSIAFMLLFIRPRSCKFQLIIIKCETNSWRDSKYLLKFLEDYIIDWESDILESAKGLLIISAIILVGQFKNSLKFYLDIVWFIDALRFYIFLPSHTLF